MKSRSLPILGAIFLCAFLGRAITLAADGATQKASEGDAPGPACVTGELASELILTLNGIESRQTALAEREGDAAAVSARVEARIAELESLNAKLRETLTQSENHRAADLKRISSIYEQMKPTQAATIFRQMAPPFAAGLLASMNEDAASAILAALDPERAYLITAIMTRDARQGGRKE